MSYHIWEGKKMVSLELTRTTVPNAYKIKHWHFKNIKHARTTFDIANKNNTSLHSSETEK